MMAERKTPDGSDQALQIDEALKFYRESWVDLNFRNYNADHTEIQAIFARHPDDTREAENVIWLIVEEATGDPDLACLLSSAIAKRHPKYKRERDAFAIIQREELRQMRERRTINRLSGGKVVFLEQRRKAVEAERRKAIISGDRKALAASTVSMETAIRKYWSDYTKLAKIHISSNWKPPEDRITVQELENRPLHSDSAAEKIPYSQPFMLPKKIDVNRNITLFKRACSGFAKGDSPESVWAVLKIENIQKCYEPLTESELRQLFKSAEKGHLRRQADAKAGVKQTFSDQANACRLIAEHCEYIRYVKENRGWCIYDGARWIFDPPGGLYPLVRQTTEGLYQWAVTLDGDERQKMLREIQALESLNKQKAMIEMAATIPEIIISPSQLDSDQYLLNINGGTLDLRTGSLKIPVADDYISKLASVNYNPSAVCPIWLAFLFKIMGGNQRLIDFLQRVIGYCLTGDTSEQCFFILYGSGANGKSTLMNIIRYLLADYAAQAAPDILMAKDRQGGASPELARLPGVRFVATSETEDGQQFAEASLKQMTGQDTITARHLYKEYFEFRPQFKIFFATNHKPTIKGTENAIWRRVNLIPFAVTIPAEEQDRNLEQKLMQELPGILNWAVTGCMEWQKNGLQPPEEVKAAVNEYRKDMDIISQWLDECCVLIPSLLTPQKRLYPSYKVWSEENLGWSMKPQKFGRVLIERGFIRVLQPAAAYRGIGILAGESDI